MCRCSGDDGDNLAGWLTGWDRISLRPAKVKLPLPAELRYLLTRSVVIIWIDSHLFHAIQTKRSAFERILEVDSQQTDLDHPNDCHWASHCCSLTNGTNRTCCTWRQLGKTNRSILISADRCRCRRSMLRSDECHLPHYWQLLRFHNGWSQVNFSLNKVGLKKIRSKYMWSD